MNSKNISNCNFVKGILMFLVIFYHSCLYMTEGWFPYITTDERSSFLLLLAEWVGSFHIYTFTLVSGYLFFWIKNERGGYGSYKQFLIKKIKRLVVPAFFISVIWAAPFGYLYFGYTLKNIIIKYILGVAPNQLWFLWMLFWVFVIAWPLDHYKVFSSEWGGLISLFLYMIGIVFGRIIPNIFQIWTGCEYVLFFWIGYKIRKKEGKSKYEITNLQVVLLLICDLILFFINRFVKLDSSYMKLFHTVVGILICVIGCIAVFGALQIIATQYKVGDSCLIRKINKKTMGMFLFHQQIIYIVLWVLGGSLNPYLQVVLNFVISSIAAFIITTFALRWKLTRWLIGENA